MISSALKEFTSSYHEPEIFVLGRDLEPHNVEALMLAPIVKRLMPPVVLAAFLAVCFQTTVYTEFEKIRNNLIGRAVPATGRTVEVFFGKSDLAGGAKLLHFRVRNDGPIPKKFLVKVNGVPLNEFTVTAHDSVNTAFEPDAFPLRPNNKIVVIGDSGGWTLERAVAANLYGSNQGLFKYVIVSSNSTLHSSPPFGFSLLVFFFFSLLAPFLVKRKFPKVKSIFLWFVITFLLVVLLLPQFSSYRLLLSPRAFFLFLAPLYLSSLGRAYTHLYRSAERFKPGYGNIFQSLVVVLVVSWFSCNALVFHLNEFEGDWSRFLWLEEKYLEKNPFLKRRPNVRKDLSTTTEGYDAQFFYYIAFDPALNQFKDRPQQYRKLVDNPPHRFRRVGFPILTKVFSLNRPELFPKTMVLLIVVSHLIGSFVLSRIAIHFGRSPYWGLLYMMVPAFPGSLRVGLPESISATLLLTGVFFYWKDRLSMALVFFASSLLVRETGSFVILFLVVQEALLQKNMKRAAILSVALVPYAGWRGFVTYRLFPDYGWSAFFYEGPNFDLPYRGIVLLLQNEDLESAFYPVVLTLALLIAVFQARYRKDFLAWSALIYGALAVSLSYHQVWTALNNAERNTYELYLVLILSFFSLEPRFSSFKKIFVMFWIVLLIYDLYFLSVAPIFRAGIWYPLQS